LRVSGCKYFESSRRRGRSGYEECCKDCDGVFKADSSDVVEEHQGTNIWRIYI